MGKMRGLKVDKMNSKMLGRKLREVIGVLRTTAVLIEEKVRYIINITTDFIFVNTERAKAFIGDKKEKTVVFLSDTAYKTKGHLFNAYDKVRFLKSDLFGHRDHGKISFEGGLKPKLRKRVAGFAVARAIRIREKMPKSGPEAMTRIRGSLRVLRYETRKMFSFTKDGSVRSFRYTRDYVTGIRKSTVAGLGAIAICGFSLVFVITTVVGSYAMSVTINGQQVGFVENEEELAAIVEVAEKEISEENQNINIKIDEDAIELDAVVNSKSNEDVVDEETLIKTAMDTDAVISTAAAISVNGEPVLYVGNQDEAEEVLTAIKDKYDVTGEDVISGFRQDVTITDATVDFDELMPTSSAVTYLLTGNKTIKKHKVKGNETDWDIAVKYGLTEKDIRKSNPGVNTKVIKKGDVLNISKMVPFVKMEVLATVGVSEKIDYKTQKIETDDLYVGESEVKKEGKKGEAFVTERAIFVNGKEESAQLIQKKVVKKPQTRVVLVGTKEKPEESYTSSYSSSGGTSSSSYSSSSSSSTTSSNSAKSKGGGSYVSSSVGLSNPMRSMTLSSGFGYRGGRMHTGCDFRNPSGTPVYASAAGKVTSSGYDGAYGNTVRISHGGGMTTVYSHLSSIYVKSGSSVSRGQQVGTVGMTGRATGYHLHFEVRINGTARNPLNYL